MNDIFKFEPIEPLIENRYIINIVGTYIPQFLFRKYKIHNEGEELIFTTEFYETVNFTFNPKDFFEITGVKIDYLSPIGEVVSSLEFKIKGSNFEKEQSYSNSELQTNKLKFIMDKESIQLTPKSNEENGRI
jgi:hypothetical protein